ncbi:peptide deformylase [Haloechinothrix sp. LS1_15]|uniref:peptide deformylase n=1 Tax=Haloechinothrix sp. LS1_15 TaxID=2652248 RepID=UPI0029446CAD|nr:peptide deformylase [Haloechinothrix sp. LS1_15]MDV6014509.1 peptide deformylase [Haloechinothrix sp. LS1_15]
MAVRNLRYFGDPVLKTVSEPITRFDASTRTLVNDLLDTVNLPGRAGLAAPQIGVNLRAFSYHERRRIGYVINPEIVELSEEVRELDEACLSVPEMSFPTPRATRAVVRGVDLRNEPVIVEGTGELAQCLQHEVDHLDGMLYLDRLSTERRKDAFARSRKRPWFWSR